MKILTPIRARKASRAQDLKLAILAAFSLPRVDALNRLADFNEADWEKTLWWLDISGMALYFIDQIWCLGAESALPGSIEAKLNMRLQRNRIRAQAMFNEAALLSAWFNGANAPYAVLKGITLAPNAVPDPALRWQADLDFLVPEKNSALAAHYIQRLGYRMYARSGKTLEFRAGLPGLPDMSRMYSNQSERALELHLCDFDGDHTHRFHRRELRHMQNTSFFALSQEDIFVQQALHLLKHLSGEHTRVSWVLEFWRNVQAHRFDYAFWPEVERISATEPNGDLAIAIAFWLANALFGFTGLDTPPQWCAGNLPERIRLWLELYATEILLSDNIGSKLYALLKQEIPGPARDTRSVRQVLLPARLPLRIPPSAPHEHLLHRGKRILVQLNYVAHRLRFHFIEGIRFALQSARWRKAVARCEQ
jgi:hypothetical protein